MSQLRPLAIDLAYRPESYFWAYDNNIKLASDIKGAERKAMYERALRSGDIELANAIISEPELTHEQRKAQSGIHPAWMGGEYLPKREVQGFIVDASSSFYAEFGDLVAQRVDAWVDQRREEQGLNELNSDDEDDE